MMLAILVTPPVVLSPGLDPDPVMLDTIGHA